MPQLPPSPSPSSSGLGGASSHPHLLLGGPCPLPGRLQHRSEGSASLTPPSVGAARRTGTPPCPPCPFVPPPGAPPPIVLPMSWPKAEERGEGLGEAARCAPAPHNGDIVRWPCSWEAGSPPPAAHGTQPPPLWGPAGGQRAPGTRGGGCREPPPHQAARVGPREQPAATVPSGMLREHGARRGTGATPMGAAWGPRPFPGGLCPPWGAWGWVRARGKGGGRRESKLLHLLRADGSLKRWPFSMGRFPQGMVLPGEKQRGYGGGAAPQGPKTHPAAGPCRAQPLSNTPRPPRGHRGPAEGETPTAPQGSVPGGPEQPPRSLALGKERGARGTRSARGGEEGSPPTSCWGL